MPKRKPSKAATKKIAEANNLFKKKEVKKNAPTKRKTRDV